LEPHIQMYHDLFTHNAIWLQRTQHVGVLTPEVAQDYCITGPVARASGVDWDLRKKVPYAAYPDYEFNVPLRTEGDSYARYMVRMLEMSESVKICRQALKKIEPAGPYRTTNRKVVPPPRWEITVSMESLI